MIDAAPDIRYLSRSEIDITKWDRCILESPNGLIYARSFYLDAMSENWSGLITGDYQYVMPLTWNKKFGFSYLYQPYFTKVLGVFGKNSQPIEISGFLKAIPEKFKYWDIDLNEKNFVSNEDKKFRLIQYARTNYFLGLQDEYEKIKLQYKRLANRMNRKAVENSLQISRSEEPAIIIDLYRKGYEKKHRQISESIYDKLNHCMDFAFKNKLAETYIAKSSSGDTLAYYMILIDDRFVYSLIGGSTSEGKKLGAFYFLTDAIIRDHAGMNRTFRFEGSDIPGISFFDALFGPEKISYQHLVMNSLPFPISLFK
jgi:hypothetical protein